MGVLTFWPLGAWGQGSFLSLLYYDLLDWTSPVVCDSRTVRDSLCPLFFRKKADGKKRRGRDWEVFRAGDLAPDLFGASVHHPWAGRAGATGRKAVGWGGFAAVVPLFFRLFSRIGSLPSRKWLEERGDWGLLRFW